MRWETTAFQWLSRATGILVSDLTLTRIAGATSSSLFRIGSRAAPKEVCFVLRVLDNADWLAREPELAEREAAALKEAERASLPAPRLVAHAAKGPGFGAPVVLMTLVPGRVDLTPANLGRWIDALADQLAAVHAHKAADFPWTFNSWVEWDLLAVPAWTRRPDLWEQAIAWARSRRRSAGERGAGDPAWVFLHRDYHPVNVLWREAAVSGIVDWINACRGPAGVDVAHCRVNLALMYGVAAAERFRLRYERAAGGGPYDPFWDVDAALNLAWPKPVYYRPWRIFGLPPIPEETLAERAEEFLRVALSRVR